MIFDELELFEYFPHRKYLSFLSSSILRLFDGKNISN